MSPAAPPAQRAAGRRGGGGKGGKKGKAKRSLKPPTVQGGTSHCLGQSFAEMFDIEFETVRGGMAKV